MIEEENLKEQFNDYISDCLQFSTEIFIHWHDLVSEFVVYVDGKFYDYVPEEYIYKSSFENYKMYKDRWETNHKIQNEQEIVRAFIKTFIQSIKDENLSSSNYQSVIRFYLDIIFDCPLSADFKNITLKRISERLKVYSEPMWNFFVEESSKMNSL